MERAAAVGWLGMRATQARANGRWDVNALSSEKSTTSQLFTPAPCRQQLEAIAEVVREHPRLLVLSDEIYEYIIYA